MDPALPTAGNNDALPEFEEPIVPLPELFRRDCGAQGVMSTAHAH